MKSCNADEDEKIQYFIRVDSEYYGFFCAPSLYTLNIRVSVDNEVMER